MDVYLVIANNTYKTINVNDEELSFDFEVPEGFSNYQSLSWRKNNPNPNNPDGIIIFQKEGETLHLEATEENYNTYFKYYVDLWQAEKDRLAAEEVYFPKRQQTALENLNADFETVKERAHLKSSLGFEIDANSTAKENVQGLIEEVGTGTVQFCDYYNQFHELNKAQLETLKSEINQNGQALYAQKWQYRTAIEACTDNEELDAVVAGIEFTYMDFTPPTDTGEAGSTETDQTTDGATE